MLRFRHVFSSNKCNVIGMIHIGALPGTPNYEGSIQKLIDGACSEAEVYNSTTLDGVLLENMHDIPYIQPKSMGPETVAAMTRICTEARKVLQPHIPCGVQVLAGANKQAIAVAQAAGLLFIRAEGFVFGHVADEGYTDANAGELLRYRKSIGADNILIFTDIKKKHSSHAITSDITLAETAEAAEFFLSDGVIITGRSTGDPADRSQLKDVKQHTNMPVLIGSGVTRENLCNYIEADAVIVGTHFKKNGRWQNGVDKDRVQQFMDVMTKVREQS